MKPVNTMYTDGNLKNIASSVLTYFTCILLPKLLKNYGGTLVTINRKLSFIIYACLFLVFPYLVPILSAEILSLSNDVTTVSLGSNAMCIEDKSGELSFENIISSKTNSLWKKNNTKNINIGFTDSVYWIKLIIKNESDINTDFYFEIAYPVLDYIDVYTFHENGPGEKTIMGDKYPFKYRSIKHRNFVFPLQIRSHGVIDVYLRVKTSSSMQLPLYLHKKLSFIERGQKQIIVLGLFYGSIIIMVLYNLLIFIAIREKQILYYVLYITGIAVFVASLNGTCFQFFWPENLWLNDKALVLSIGSITFFGILFTSVFLKIPETMPGINKLYNCIIIINCLIVLLNLFNFSYKYCIKAIIVIAFLTIIISLNAGVIRLYQGYLSARYYVLAIISMLVSAAIPAMSKFGFAPVNFYTEYSLYLGAICEALFLSFALADRINIDKKERNKSMKFAHEQEKKTLAANKKRLENQKKATETMELKVAERTSELNHTLTKVEHANKHIMSSLRYASMIQLSILPNNEKIQKWFKDYFIIWIPKTIVGGDFYYIDKVDGKYIIVVADCTKHGIPGAFLTMLSNTELKRIIIGEKCLSPGEILKNLHIRIKKALKLDTENAFSDEGLELAVCVIDPDKNELVFAGARQNLYYTQDNKLYTINGDKESIGFIKTKNDIMFTEHSITMNTGTNFYIPTDGVTSQINSKTGKEFGVDGLKELILANHTLPLQKQQIRIMHTLEKERHCGDIIDDVTFVAFSSDLIY